MCKPIGWSSNEHNVSRSAYGSTRLVEICVGSGKKKKRVNQSGIQGSSRIIIRGISAETFGDPHLVALVLALVTMVSHSLC